MFRTLCLFVFFSLLISCTHSKNNPRWPQSETNLPELIEKHFLVTQKEPLTKENCGSYLKELRSEVIEEKVQYLDSSWLQSHADDLDNQLWSIRLTLHDQIGNVPTCRNEIFKTLYQIRYVQDLIGTEAGNFKAQKPADIKFFDDKNEKRPVPFKSDEKFYGYNFRPGINLKNFEFRSGDIMVTRGVSFFSAALTRTKDVDGQFSHFVLVHVNDQTGKVSTIESYAQTGGVTDFDINYALQNENSRILVLRPRDPILAKKAADLIMKKVMDLKSKGQQIPYDYRMNIKDPSSMTCAEVAHYAYRWASNEKFNIPESKSSIVKSMQDFMSSAGIPDAAVLAPRDMETDSRFEMIAEFKDYRILRDLIYRDVLMTKIYEWMSEKNYRLNHSLKTLFTPVVWVTRQTPLWPLAQRFGAPDFPKGTPLKFFTTLSKLNEVADIIYSELELADLKFQDKTGRWMTTSQLLAVLEEIRENDLKRYLANDNKAFHNMLKNRQQVRSSSDSNY